MRLLNKLHCTIGNKVHAVLVFEADILAAVIPVIALARMGNKFENIGSFPQIVKTGARGAGRDPAQLFRTIIQFA